MMSIEEIRRINSEKEAEARAIDQQPYVATKDNDKGVINSPYIGDYIPSGWKLINTHFVDNSGFGADDELALSFRQFLLLVKKGHGYSISSAGQFQVYINEFERE